MRKNGGDEMHVVRAMFLYDGDNMGVVHVLFPNEGNNMHAVRALMSELAHPCSMTIETFGSCK